MIPFFLNVLRWGLAHSQAHGQYWTMFQVRWRSLFCCCQVESSAGVRCNASQVLCFFIGLLCSSVVAEWHNEVFNCCCWIVGFSVLFVFSPCISGLHYEAHILVMSFPNSQTLDHCGIYFFMSGNAFCSETYLVWYQYIQFSISVVPVRIANFSHHASSNLFMVLNLNYISYRKARYLKTKTPTW